MKNSEKIVKKSHLFYRVRLYRYTILAQNFKSRESRVAESRNKKSDPPKVVESLKSC